MNQWLLCFDLYGSTMCGQEGGGGGLHMCACVCVLSGDMNILLEAANSLEAIQKPAQLTCIRAIQRKNIKIYKYQQCSG
jgi:hypothetical protein